MTTLLLVLLVSTGPGLGAARQTAAVLAPGPQAGGQGRLTAAPVSLLARAQQPAEPQQQEEFVPIDQLPPQDQLPAAPLLVAAYAVVLIGLFLYVLSVARRMASVQREIERLEADVKRVTKAS